MEPGEASGKRRYRIANCIDNLNPAGAQQVLRLLVQYGDAGRFDHRVYTFKDGVLAQQIKARGIPVTVLRRRVPKFDPWLVRRIAKQLARDGIDLLNTHLFGATLHGWLAAGRVGGIPVVATAHTLEGRQPLLNRLGNRWLLPACDVVIAVSQAADESLRHHERAGARIITIPNGIDMPAMGGEEDRERAREQFGVPAGARVIGTVGHLRPAKDHGMLIRALNHLRQAHVDAYVVIVGEDLGSQAELQAEARRLGVADALRLLGKREDVALLLHGFDVFALSSRWEGLPMALLEAMSAGLPCVCTNVGGVPDAIQEAENGLLVSAGDAAAMAEALGALLDDDALAQRLGLAGRQTVADRFSASRMAAQYERVYVDLLDRERAE